MRNFLPKKKFDGKLFLGVDYGTQVLGTALYEVGRDPFPLPFEKLAPRNDEEAISLLQAMAQEEGIRHILLGLPLHLDGTDSPMAQRIRRFGKALALSRPPLAVFYQDEALSSQRACELMASSPSTIFG